MAVTHQLSNTFLPGLRRSGDGRGEAGAQAKMALTVTAFIVTVAVFWKDDECFP